MKTLIVDDSEENLYMLESLLKGYDHDVLSARNGLEALDLISENDIGLIISDILMPVMDGFQLCRKIKSDKNMSDIPFIIYTATYTDEKDEDFALKLGADGFIIKPCDPEVFIKAVNKIIEKFSHKKKGAEPEITEEKEVFKQYSERLIKKLEQKMEQLEREVDVRKKAEDELKENRERLIAAQKIAKVGDFTWNVETGEITWSEGMFDLLKYEKSETFDYQKLNNQIHHPDDLQNINAWLNKCIESENKKLPPYEYRVICKDGEIKHVRTVGIIMRNKGSPTTVFATVQDITDLKKAEKDRDKYQSELLQSQKMESIGRLAGGIAHDFNNMLSVIVGHLDLAKLKLPKDHFLMNDINKMQEAAEQSANLVEQLLGFARKQPAVPAVIDLNKTVSNSIEMLTKLVGKNIEIIWQPDQVIKPVYIDPTQTNQLLINLVVNASDAMEEKGKILIETDIANIDKTYCDTNAEFIPGKYVVISVSDNGSGMDEETKKNIFEPFYTTKDRGKGTGLGLSTVYGIVKQNKGFIYVESEIGKGTKFKIYLPVSKKDKVKPNTNHDSQDQTSGGKETILLVDDSLTILDLSKKMLESLGYTVIAKNSADKAIKAADEYEGKIHLLITNVLMPGTKGSDLADNVRNFYPAIKCLYMSGHSSDVIAHQGLMEEETNFIQKPFTIDKLAKNIRQILEQDASE